MGKKQSTSNADKPDSELIIKLQRKTKIKLLKQKGYKKASLAVQKVNYAVKMYEKVGFKSVDENSEEYIMVCQL